MSLSLMFQTEPQNALAALWDGGRFPHALLIEGPTGSGKRTMARYAASLILCRDSKPPCGACTSCHKIDSGNHPDVDITDLPDKPRSIGVEVIRRIRREAYIAPHESDRRVFILAQAQNMTIEAQNALLKILEEPPESAMFILTALSKGSMTETVASRVVCVSMGNLTQDERLEAITALSPKSDPARLTEAAFAADTVGQALVLLGDDSLSKCQADASLLVELALISNRYEMLKLLSPYQKDRELCLKLISSARLHAVKLSEQDLSKMPPLRCLRFADILNKAYLSAVQNVGLTLVFAVLVGELSQA